MNRGEIYFIKSNKLENDCMQMPDRPAVIVSNDMLNATRSTFQVCYGGDAFYISRNGKEYMLYRGGSPKTGTSSGIFQGSFAIMRDSSVSNAGFRAAYIPYI